MNLRYCLIAIAVMAVVTYIPRFVPITFFRREIKSVYLKNFLDYTPYAVLGALTFPDIFSSSGNPVAAIVETRTCGRGFGCDRRRIYNAVSVLTAASNAFAVCF